jgi:hypothetical protein
MAARALLACFVSRKDGDLICKIFISLSCLDSFIQSLTLMRENSVINTFFSMECDYVD